MEHGPCSMVVNLYN